MRLHIFTDGGSRGNPGKAAIGVVIKSTNSEKEIGKTIGVTTNNVAEYTALLTAIQTLKADSQEGIDGADFFLDSLLVVQQMKGVYAIKDQTLKSLASKARELISTLPYPVTFSHIPRRENAQADALVNKALDADEL